MKLINRFFAIALLAMMALTVSAQVNELPRSTAAAQGVEAKAIVDFFDTLLAIPETEMHHVMVLRHGTVIGEMHPTPFRAEDSHTLYSESKTFCSMAVGLCVDDNLLRVTDRIATFFPGLLPDTVSDNLANMTIKDVLTMTAGIKPDWNFRSQCLDWERFWLSRNVADKPGTKYQYDSMCTFMLSCIVQKVTGKTVLQLLQERIFDPMGIKQAEWELSPDGVNTGGWGLRLQAESQAKFGQLLLQKGMWNDKQLISQKWVEEASSTQVYPYKKGTEADIKSPGYGYQIWRSERPGSFRADGALGQYVVVIPDKDMVVLINGAGFQTPKELKAIWNQLMPGVKDEPITRDSYQKRLEKLEATASLPVPKGDMKKNKTINLNNGELVFTYNADGTMDYTYDGRTIHSTHGKWNYVTNSQQPPYSISPKNMLKGLKQDFTAASRYGWVTARDFTVETFWVDFITSETIEVEFYDTEAKMAHVTVRRNYSRKPIYDAKVSYTVE